MGPDNRLKFDTRISNICTKSKQQLSALSRSCKIYSTNIEDTDSAAEMY